MARARDGHPNMVAPGSFTVLGSCDAACGGQLCTMESDSGEYDDLLERVGVVPKPQGSKAAKHLPKPSH